jgi:hypothetical protein
VTKIASLFSRRTFLWFFFAPLVAANVVSGKRLHHLAAERTKIKEDYAQVNSFEYGLLSADVWKGMIQEIVDARIRDFKLTPKNQEILEKETAQVLNELLEKADNLAKKRENGLGTVKAHFARSYVKAARRKLPELSEAVVGQLQKPATMQKLRDMAVKQFNVYAAQTHSLGNDAAKVKGLLSENNAASVDEFNSAARRKIKDLDAQSRFYAGGLVGTALLFILAWRFVLKGRRLQRPFFSLSLGLASILLATSLSIPMMEIDARIQSIDIMLIGERFRFNEQVVYYRSKSLMQVVQVMMRSGKADSIAVAVLILVFSILFPMLKLLSAELYLRGNERMRNSKLVHFFAFKSGKWSMADVTVVAIFMAYIGFETIVHNQLQKLNMSTSVVESVTTDASSMQPGYALFTTFVLYSMFLSVILKKITARGSFPRPPVTEITENQVAIRADFSHTC